jgi:proteasome lid subunit RPN8/RPN11
VSRSPAGDQAAVRLASAVHEAIRQEAARAYPHEGCGALLGRERDVVSEALPLANEETGSPRTRFLVSPLDYLAVEEQADARGLKLLGFWHSHPDHPARPSATDRQYAWPGLLTVVIAVERGTPAGITAWDVDGPEAPFRERELRIGASRETRADDDGATRP